MGKPITKDIGWKDIFIWKDWPKVVEEGTIYTVNYVAYMHHANRTVRHEMTYVSEKCQTE